MLSQDLRKSLIIFVAISISGLADQAEGMVIGISW